MNTLENLDDFIGKKTVFAVGVVEEVADPLTLGRVKARYFGYHTPDKSKIPTVDLPWSQVLQSSASTSGVGFSPNYLKPDSWVFAIFLDGEAAQFPLILGSLPRIHQASAPDSYIGNSGSGYRNSSSLYSGDPVPPNPNSVSGEFYPQARINPGGGSVIADDGSHLTKQNIPSWPLKVYKPTPARGDFGLACKDADQSLFIHYASALALEELGKRFGTYPKINSAYRSPSYNAAVGGAKLSQHTKGRAFDIPYDSIGGSSQGNLIRFAQTAVQCGFVGFGLYNSFIHIDTGSGRVWNGAKAAWFVNGIKAAGWYSGKPGLQDVRTSNNQTTQQSNTNIDTTTTSSTSNIKTRNDVKNLIAEKMKAAGYNDYAIAAAQAHASHESSFDPNSYNKNDRDGSPSEGLFQWHKSRQTAMLNAGGRGNPEKQVDFFLSELSGSHSSAGNMLRNARSPEEANLAMKKFEGYSDDGRETAARLQTTKEFMMGKDASNAGFSQQQQGFTDSSGSLPYGEYQGKPSTHHTVVGFNGNLYQPEIQKNNDARLTGMPVAGNKGTVGEPEIPAGPQYPFNYAYASLTGHMWEMDDTPGVERVNFQHSNGSKLAMSASGTVVTKAMGNYYSVAGGSSYTLTMGAYNLSAVEDIDIRTTSDMTLHADGSITILSNNDSVEHVAGKKDILVGETLQIKANRLIVEAENIDFVASKSITMEAGENISIRAGATMATSAKDTKIYSSGSFDADASSMGWLEGKAKEIPEMTGKTTDLGKAPKRAIIERGKQKQNSDNAPITTDDVIANYAPNDPTKRMV